MKHYQLWQLTTKATTQYIHVPSKTILLKSIFLKVYTSPLFNNWTEGNVSVCVCFDIIYNLVIAVLEVYIGYGGASRLLNHSTIHLLNFIGSIYRSDICKYIGKSKQQV